jgi:ATP-binding cassette subfamily B protein
MAPILTGLQQDNYDRQYSDGYLFRRMGTYFASYRSQLVWVVFGFVMVSVVSALPTIWIADSVALLEREGVGGTLILLIGALLVAAVVQYVANYIRRRLLTLVVAGVVTRMREDAYAAAVNRDLAFYDTHKSGKVVSRITSDTQEFGDVLLLASDVLSQLVQVAILLFVLLDRSVALTLLLLGTLPMTVGAAMGFRALARRATRRGSRAMAVVNDNIQESVTGISVAKNFRKEAMIYDEFVAVNRQSYRVNLWRGFVLAMIFPVLNALAGLAIGLVLFVGGQYVAWGWISISSWFLFIQAVDRFWFPFINMAAIWSQFQQALSSAERIFALIDAENTVVQTDTQAVGQLAGKVEFIDVTFGYGGDQPPVLKHFNLTIEPGENIAFVGHTGAGKSTITKLITRFYEFQEGQILIDGRDIRSFDLESYRARLGIVPQQPFLFSGTILDNIRYSRPEATEEEVSAIAYSVGGGEWLETLADGLHTDVGERGARLSMGQRQLVALIRVLLERPTIFILDEATASVDPFTETQIQETLDLILAQSTSILIAHRLSTIRNADRIIVLREGEIIEQGDHSHLMAQGGHYAELYNTYFRHQSLDYIENARELLAESQPIAGD